MVPEPLMLITVSVAPPERSLVPLPIVNTSDDPTVEIVALVNATAERLMRPLVVVEPEERMVPPFLRLSETPLSKVILLASSSVAPVLIQV